MRLFRTWLLVALVASLISGVCVNVLPAPAPVSRQGPPMPLSKSPVEVFRKLIAASSSEVNSMLSNKSPEQQKLIRAKIDEYRLYPPQVREWRLKATELRWYLMPLITRRPDARGQLLETVPEADRPLVEARLKQWDRLSEAEQKALLNNDLALQYVSRPNSAPAPSPAQLKNLPPQSRVELDKAIDQWRSMSDQQRQDLANRFSNFFRLNASEQSRTLGLLTANERAQLQKQIVNFADLKPADRDRCLAAVRRFSRMSEEERLVFMQGAERWRSMTDRQRNAWRALVTKLPPLPPGALMPPLPPGFRGVSNSAALAPTSTGRELAASNP